MGRNLIKRSRFSGYKGMDRIGRDARAKMKELQKEASDPELSRGYNSSEIGVKWVVSEQYAFDQLMKGSKIEMEHTPDEETATTIASQHLYKEGIEYYNKLEKMENELKKENMTNTGTIGEGEQEYLDGMLDKFLGFLNLDKPLYNISFKEEPMAENPEAMKLVAVIKFSDTDDTIELSVNEEDSSDVYIRLPNGKSYVGSTDEAANYVNEYYNMPTTKIVPDIKYKKGDEVVIFDRGAYYLFSIKEVSDENVFGWMMRKVTWPDQEVLEFIDGMPTKHPISSIVGYAKKYSEKESAKIKADESIVSDDTPSQIDFKNKLERINFIKALIDQKGDDIMKYSESELQLLRTYEGMGGQSQKVTEINLGLLDQFYTPYIVIEKMWGLAFKYGFTFTGKKTIIEPSCGIGRFFEYVPEGHNVIGYEIDKYAYTIAKITFPNFKILNEPFETMFWDTKMNIKKPINQTVDLFIGNPPYRDLESKYTQMKDVMGKTEKDLTEAKTFDQYMLARGIDLLIPGGLLVFIIPNSFLANKSAYNSLKNRIAERATLVDAYRLPNGVFTETNIGTDIVVFKKK